MNSNSLTDWLKYTTNNELKQRHDDGKSSENVTQKVNSRRFNLKIFKVAP